MKKTFSKYLPFLASENNILLLSDKSYKEYDGVCELFNDAIHRAMVKEELENINATLSHHLINIVLLDSDCGIEITRKFFDAIKAYDLKILIILIATLDAKNEIMPLIKDADATLFAPFTQEELNDKLFANLGLFYIVRSIGKRDIRLKKSSKQLETLSVFLDKYEGSSLFIVDELNEISEALKAGELSKELLERIIKIMDDISLIFEKNSEVSSAAPVIKELTSFLNNLEIETLKPSALKAFDYLAATVDDIGHILTDMFVDRIIGDVYVFRDSLKSNIEFMESAFFSKEDDGDLEFMND